MFYDYEYQYGSRAFVSRLLPLVHSAHICIARDACVGQCGDESSNSDRRLRELPLGVRMSSRFHYNALCMFKDHVQGNGAADPIDEIMTLLLFLLAHARLPNPFDVKFEVRVFQVGLERLSLCFLKVVR